MESQYFDLDYVRGIVARGEHREIVGAHWNEIGSLQFEFLKSAGLKPFHCLLDVGCGCLRGGVHFISYLEPGKYIGIDINQSLLDAGYDVELKRAGLTDRLPRENLRCISDFRFNQIDQRFDFALAQSLFTHLTFNSIRICLENIAPVLKPGAIFFATFFEVPQTQPTGCPHLHASRDVITAGANDPYHYRFSDFEYATSGLQLRPEYIGDWGHPRSQKMLAFHRVADEPSAR